MAHHGHSCGQFLSGGDFEPGAAGHRDDLDPVAPGLRTVGEPLLERLLRAALNHVQQPSRPAALTDGGEVDDDGDVLEVEPLTLDPALRTITGVAAGVGIGVAAALMGVAGGEPLIPTIVLLFAVDIKIAGSLSLAVSLRTMLVAFARYSRDDSFTMLATHKRFVAVMATGSVAGTVLGSLLLGLVPTAILIPFLVALLLTSSIKVWRPQ